MLVICSSLFCLLEFNLRASKLPEVMRKQTAKSNYYCLLRKQIWKLSCMLTVNPIARYSLATVSSHMWSSVISVAAYYYFHCYFHEHYFQFFLNGIRYAYLFQKAFFKITNYEEISKFLSKEGAIFLKIYFLHPR